MNFCLINIFLFKYKKNKFKFLLFNINYILYNFYSDQIYFANIPPLRLFMALSYFVLRPYNSSNFLST